VQSLLYGFSVGLTPTNLLYCALGVFLGTIVGVLPGIGPLGGITLLLPTTFGMEPVSAIIMLAGIYYGAGSMSRAERCQRQEPFCQFTSPRTQTGLTT
jgi:putative tricarboxylic transport membrane protein